MTLFITGIASIETIEKSDTKSCCGRARLPLRNNKTLEVIFECWPDPEREICWLIEGKQFFFDGSLSRSDKGLIILASRLIEFPELNFPLYARVTGCSILY